MGPGVHKCHTRDLSAFIDIAGVNYEEVGIRGNQGVKVGHHIVLPNKAAVPVEPGVKEASHHLAFAVDAGGYGGKFSGQSVEVCEFAVQPKRAKFGCAVSATDYSSDLALVVNGLRDRASSEVRKGEDRVVFPPYGANNRPGTIIRLAYGLALIVDAEGEPVWILIHRRKSVGFALFP